MRKAQQGDSGDVGSKQHIFKLNREEEELFNLFRKEYNISIKDIVMNYIKLQLNGYDDNSFIGVQQENTHVLTKLYDEYMESVKRAEVNMSLIRNILSKDMQTSSEYLKWYISDNKEDTDWIYVRLMKQLEDISDYDSLLFFIKDISKRDYASDISKLKPILRAKFLRNLNSTMTYNGIKPFENDMKLIEQIFGMTMEQAMILANRKV